MAENKIENTPSIDWDATHRYGTGSVPPGCAPAGPGAFTVWVKGVPGPQGSKRHVGRGVMIESSKKVKPWREAVDAHARAVLGLHAFPFPSEPVMVKIVFVLPRTKAMRARPGGAFPMVQKPDIDKLVRSTLDALGTAGVWGDDSQVVTLHAHKRRGEPGEPTGALIHVELVPAAVVPLDAPRVLMGLPGEPIDHAQCACSHYFRAHVGQGDIRPRCWVPDCSCPAFAPLTPSAVQ
jgi:crossover junction endodeoxyribonuclease RusA